MIAGQNQQRPENHTASMRFITPGYFPAMGIPLKLGRGVEESDGATALPVAVVSESFVQRYWPGQNAIGRSFQIASGTRTIVGVAGNVMVRGPEAPSEPQVYLSYRQMRDGDPRLVCAEKDLAIRTTVSPTSLTAAIRAIIHDADPQQPVSDVQTLTEIVESNTASRRVQARVLGALRGDCPSARGRGDSRTALILGIAADAGDRSADGSRREGSDRLTPAAGRGLDLARRPAAPACNRPPMQLLQGPRRLTRRSMGRLVSRRTADWP